MNKSVLKSHIVTIFVFITIGLISFFFIPTHDDLINLSCTEIKEAFKSSLYYGNGRFLGNFLVSVFLNNEICDSLIRMVVFGGTVVLSAILISGYRASSICVSFFLYLGIGLPIFKQSVVWGHGFYNYAPLVFFILLVLTLLKCNYQQDTIKAK